MTSSYTYNAEGLRTSKTVLRGNREIVTDYVWGSNGLAGVRCGDDVLVLCYNSEGEAIGFTLNGDVYQYVKNLQGDVLYILDESGEEVVTYDYDPWGVQTVNGDFAIASINPCSYRGYDYDEETGYYYLQSRYYDPEVGRFLNADEAGMIGNAQVIDDYNLFIYCENDPINYQDPTGYSPLQWICAGIGAIAGWYFGDYIARKLGYTSGAKYWAIRAGIVVGGAVIGWFAATLISKVIATYLKTHIDVAFRLANRWGISKFLTALNFLGINPISLATDSSKFIALVRVLNNRAITLGYSWAIQLYEKAVKLGYRIEVDTPHGGYNYHIHLSGGKGRISRLHIQIVYSAWQYIKSKLR